MIATATTEVASRKSSKAGLYAGYGLTGFFTLFMLFDIGMHFAMPKPALDASQQLGFPAHVWPVLAAVQTLFIILFLVPRTTVLGAILFTAYLGGATAAQVRVEGPFVFSVVTALIMWAGLYLRDARLRALLFGN
ncbi:MAG TPA: DoxX family protein [Fimbriimonas sp.]|nr:DoxX family protein [Fimbriimonas sp.]